MVFLGGGEEVEGTKQGEREGELRGAANSTHDSPSIIKGPKQHRKHPSRGAYSHREFRF